MSTGYKLTTFYIALAAVTVWAFAPSFAFAKNNKDEDRAKSEIVVNKKEQKETRKAEKREEKSEKKEFKGAATRECWDGFFSRHLPYGIWKKWTNWSGNTDCVISKPGKGQGNGTSTTTDTTAPIVSNITVRTTANKAFVSWITDEKASGAIYWSSTSPVTVGNASTKSSFEIGRGRNHYLGINGLASSTTYYAIVVSKDASGNTATSSQFTFTTKAGTTTPDTTAPVLSSISTTATSTDIKVNWTTNEAATSRVYFGTTTPLSIASTTNFVGSSSLVTSHSITLGGLSTSTLYYMVIVSEDALGNTATSTQFSTTTTSGL